jgi:hypothetical protein
VKRFHRFARTACGFFIQVRSLSDDFEIETLHYCAFLRKSNPVICLTAECGYVNHYPDNEDDEWQRLAIMPDPNTGGLSLKTSFHIMQHHYSLHQPLIPTMTTRQLVHENVANRLDLVIIKDTRDEVSLSSDPKPIRKQKQNKDEDTFGIEQVFLDLTMEPEKPVPENYDLFNDDGECDAEPYPDSQDGASSPCPTYSEDSGSSRESEPAPEFPDPGPPSPGPPSPGPPAPAPDPSLEPPVFIPTEGHVLLNGNGF